MYAVTTFATVGNGRRMKPAWFEIRDTSCFIACCTRVWLVSVAFFTILWKSGVISRLTMVKSQAPNPENTDAVAFFQERREGLVVIHRNLLPIRAAALSLPSCFVNPLSQAFLKDG